MAYLLKCCCINFKQDYIYKIFVLTQQTIDQKDLTKIITGLIQFNETHPSIHISIYSHICLTNIQIYFINILSFNFYNNNLNTFLLIRQNMQSIPRCYANINKTMEQSYYDYENYEFKFGDIDNYELINKIGKGKYSEVYTGMCTQNDEKVVVKILKPVKKSKVKREIKILHILKHPNIVSLIDLVRDPASKSTCLIFEHIENQDFKSLFPSLTDMDVRFYMFELFKALDYCHSKGIMHRDVKPQNIIVDHKKKIFKLIDWGLAEFYHMNQDYNVRVASRYFKGPQLLVDFNFYDYSLDVWSAGAMFASIIFKKEPFFMGEDNRDQLVKITKVLGTEDLYKYLKKYNIKLDEEFYKIIERCPRRPWSKFVKQDNVDLCHEDAIDLLDKMLVYDQNERILPKEAMEHKYFDPLRKK